MGPTADPGTQCDPSFHEYTQGKYHWFRGVFFQATAVGVAAFAAPGLWNAMSSVGAGGQQSPYLVMCVRRVSRFIITTDIKDPIVNLEQGGQRATILPDDRHMSHREYRRESFRIEEHSCCWDDGLRDLLGSPVHKQPLWHGLVHLRGLGCLWHHGGAVLGCRGRDHAAIPRADFQREVSCLLALLPKLWEHSRGHH